MRILSLWLLAVGVHAISPYMSLERFPKLTASALGRELYFEEPPDYLPALVERGYKIVMLSTLPRRDSVEERDYLKAKLRGVEEGTIKVDKLQLMALQAALALAFGPKAEQTDLSKTGDSGIDSWLASLDWKPTRHTIKDNSTMIKLNKPSDTASEPHEEP